jgi:hypothetical protein
VCPAPWALDEARNCGAGDQHGAVGCPIARDTSTHPLAPTLRGRPNEGMRTRK